MTLTHLPHVDGATEPYITDAVCALIAANDSRRVLETGGFLGHTSIRLAETLASMDTSAPRELIVAEIDPDRALQVDQILHGCLLENDSPVFQWRVLAQDVMQVIAQQSDESLCAAFVDDEHTIEHVTAEVEALLPKMRAGGLLLFHDVFGVCDLQQVVKRYGGYSLDFPRWGPAGGLGILQVR